MKFLRLKFSYLLLYKTWIYLVQENLKLPIDLTYGALAPILVVTDRRMKLQK